VDCPKDKNTALVDHVLDGGLAAFHCPACGGNWLSGDRYKAWQQQQPQELQNAAPMLMDVPFESSPTDTQAALCPECTHYLSRMKIGQKHSFYVERCSNCGGIWCDRGEWEVLQKMGLHGSIEQIFSADWKIRIKELEYADRERQATIEKLGEDIAERVFELAELLEHHPNGDFGVAYLMRRFDKS
jgi:Zn-finger nucleic acid-binding protein